MLSLFLITHIFTTIQAQFDYTENGDSEKYSNGMNNLTAVHTELFTKRAYSKNLAPVLDGDPFNYSDDSIPQLKVNFLLNYVRLFDLDAEKQIFSATIELKMDWRDPRLAWNETKFGGVHSIFTTTDMLWIPDARISNAKALDSVSGITGQMARIYSDGIVRLTVAYYAETTCQIDANIFPFDKQNCSLTILSISLDAQHLSLGVGVVNRSNTFAGNGEWQIIKCLPATMGFSSGGMDLVGFLIIIKRVPNFYVYVIALPCFVLTFLSIVGMFWSANAKKEQLTKLGIGLTSLVSMTVLLDMLATAIPKTEVFPLLGIYVVSCVGIISCACALVAIHPSSNLDKNSSKRSPDKQEGFDESKTRLHSIFESLKDTLWHRHFLFQLFFQTLNIVGFIVFLSFWGD